MTTVSVHPRACGEHIPFRRVIWFRPGSSPRLRGTPDPRVLVAQQLRFIPAPAGNTAVPGASTTDAPVHPRACGEHNERRGRRDGRGGSSPRLRGTRQRGRYSRPSIRFIPAPAGNTSRCMSTARPMAVHPRACGEHRAAINYHRREGGSSPRLRGTPAAEYQVPLMRRFIPAPAGNTSCSAGLSMVSTVHPRACGEHITNW